jgi:hypothetical protein
MRYLLHHFFAIRNIAVAVGAILVCLPAAPSSKAQQSAASQIPLPVLAYVGGDMDQTETRRILLWLLGDGDFDGDGLDSRDIQAAQEFSDAESRARELAEFLSKDLNADTTVTVDEVRRMAMKETVGNSSKMRGRHVYGSIYDVLAFDSNGDYVVTLNEAIRHVLARPQSDAKRRILSYLLSMDPNSDGKLTTEGATVAIDHAFQILDLDSNGQIDEEEKQLALKYKLLADLDIQMEPCALPQAEENTVLVWLAARDGGLPTNVTVSGQYDVTRLSRLHVEAGTQPIQLYLSSTEPMIWQFDGAVERLKRVIVASAFDHRGLEVRASNAGVVGLPTGIVTFLPKDDCRGLYAVKKWKIEANGNPQAEDLEIMQLSLARRLGRAPDKFLLSSSTAKLGIPSGIDLETTQSVSALVEIDPATVLAPGGVETYHILPREQGLQQLVADGKLEPVGDTYRILKSISHFPAGLNEISYILPKDVTLPSGLLTYPWVDPEDF